MEHNIYKIIVNVKDEDDLYNSFDIFNKTLREDVISYITNKLNLASIKEDIEIDLIFENELDIEKFKMAFHTYIKEHIKIIANGDGLIGTFLNI